MQTLEVNGTVQIRGVQVTSGDLICADEASIAELITRKYK